MRPLAGWRSIWVVRSAWREEQSFPRPLIWIVIGGALVPVGIALVTPLGRGSGEAIAAAAPVVLLFAIGTWLSSVRLVTEVGPGGIEVRFRGLLTKRAIPMREIAGYHAVRYRPILDYGGWGIRFGRRGMAYNIRGDRGVEILLRDGKRVLIGSQGPEELVAALDDVRARYAG